MDTRIDLSDFSPELPTSAAFDILRESVSPPFNIMVMWKDLFENAEVEPTTPIDMDGVSAVSMGTALDILLKGFRHPSWIVKNKGGPSIKKGRLFVIIHYS
ncbi:MAG: hypothetical protein GY809_07450 [Planctomycetes bacterium]|nr:hypothetical protein [Planctomycetota bacterium]